MASAAQRSCLRPACFCTTQPSPDPVSHPSLPIDKTHWQASGLARTQICLTLPPFGFLIAEKFIRSQTIACSKMLTENNQTSLSPTVRLLLLNGPLNGARWCLGALPGQMIDATLAPQAVARRQGDPGSSEVPSESPPGAISAILHRHWARWTLALILPRSPGGPGAGLSEIQEA